MGHFDSLKVAAFDVLTKVMGYAAQWTSSESNFPYTAEVFYKDPSEAEKLFGVEGWNPNTPYMEYRIGFFPGLKESVDARVPETVIIDGKGIFSVIEVTTKTDGDTFIARLSKL